MPVQERKQKAREQRSQLIVSAARELAEAEGWDAVTTRKLADRVEYSQPVLYSHFKNMDAIAAAVALEGFGELTAALTEARSAAKAAARAGEKSASEGLRAVAEAYLDFAGEHPALYQAMFVRPTQLTFATGEIPASLQEAFAAFREAVEPFARPGTDGETLTELFWSSLHGLATLQAGARLRQAHQQERVEVLVGLIAG
jgi:AcrR family transcriptional regulator